MAHAWQAMQLFMTFKYLISKCFSLKRFKSCTDTLQVKALVNEMH